MATATTEAATGRIAEPKATAGKTGPVSRRRRGARAAEPSTARFFLIKTSGNGTVERGLRLVVFCSMEMAGLRPSMESTSGRSI